MPQNSSPTGNKKPRKWSALKDASANCLFNTTCVILPGDNPLVKLYARSKQVHYLHQGYCVVLADIAKEGVHNNWQRQRTPEMYNKQMSTLLCSSWRVCFCCRNHVSSSISTDQCQHSVHTHVVLPFYLSIYNTECYKGYILVRRRVRSFVTCGDEQTWSGILSRCEGRMWACYNVAHTHAYPK